MPKVTQPVGGRELEAGFLTAMAWSLCITTAAREGPQSSWWLLEVVHIRPCLHHAPLALLPGYLSGFPLSRI